MFAPAIFVAIAAVEAHQAKIKAANARAQLHQLMVCRCQYCASHHAKKDCPNCGAPHPWMPQ